MNLFQNLDLLSVGVAIAAIGILGSVVFLQNRKSATNRTFFLFTIFAILWSIFNYFYYQPVTHNLVLWLLRIHAFFAVWYTFFLYRLFYVFPKEKFSAPNWYKFLLIPISFLTSILTLTPLVFSRITTFSTEGRIAAVDNGPGVWLFGSLIIGLVLGGFITIILRTIQTTTLDRRKFSFIIIGGLLTFVLHIIFNLLLPAAFDNPRFIPLGAVFIFPFVAFTAYAILKHKLFNIKVAGTAVLVFLLAVVTFGEVILSRELSLIVYRSSVFILVLVFGLLLIKNVLREVEQRQKIEVLAGELGTANSRLRELDKQKTEFLSIASHQLRSPLTVIKGYSSMLLENSFGEMGEKVREAVDVIFQSSQKLVTVIEDFLNITRIELGKMKYEMSDFDLKQAVETVMKELGPTIRSRGLSLQLTTDVAGHYPVHADYGKLSQVFSNLLDNAMKYTKIGGITVSLSRGENGKNRLTVKDSGVGLEPSAIGNLFQKFARADGSGKVNITGTGLGLYVARQIVEAHNGKIWAESEGPGKGSKFIVEL